MSERRFQIHSEGFTIPWEVVAPFEDQAQRNHGQTLQRLHDRGGLSPAELWCVMNRKPWSDVRRVDEAEALKWARSFR